MSVANNFLPNSGILKEIEILLVDNDCDSRALYSFLLERDGAKVTAIGSIQAALDLLTWHIPAILICDLRFLGESVDPLIQCIRELAVDSGRAIPILATSTCPPMSLAQQLKLGINSHLRKPIDVDCLVSEVWNLTPLLQTQSYESHQSLISHWNRGANHL